MAALPAVAFLPLNAMSIGGIVPNAGHSISCLSSAETEALS
jgi:hypothetical protein